jgi:hypothetical protein
MFSSLSSISEKSNMAGILYPERDYLSDAVLSGARSLYRRFATTGGTGRGVRRASAIRYKRYGKKRRIMPVAEIKFIDVAMNLTACPVGGGSSCINQVAEGTEFNTRVGRTIFGKYMVIDLTVIPPTNGAAIDSGFVALVLDHQANNALATQSDVFLVAGPYAMKNVATNAARFKILRRWTLPILSNTAGTGGVHYRLYMKLNNLKIQYTGAASGIPVTNALNMYWYSTDNTGAAATCFNIAYNIRFAFTDV